MRFPMTVSATAALLLGTATLVQAQAPRVAAPAEPSPAAVDPSPAPAQAPKPQARQPSGPAPAAVITVANATANQAWRVEIMAEGQSVRLPKALPPKATATLRLPKLTGCTVSVVAGFVGGGQVEVDEFDVCKEKTIRFTE